MDSATIAPNFNSLLIFGNKDTHVIFPVFPKSVPCRRWSFQFSMAGVVATSFRAKRGRSKSVDFFGAKVKMLLLRTRSVVQALPPDVGGAAVDDLADLDQFYDAGSFEDVLNKLGENTLAGRILVSVTDESERRQLDLYSRQRQGQQQELILKEVNFLVQRAQELVKELPAAENPIVGQVLAIKVVFEEEEDDEAGTGEQESLTEEKKKKKKKDKKRGRSAAKPQAEKKKTKAEKKKKPKKQKNVVAIAAEEENVIEEKVQPGLLEHDVLSQFKEAELEFAEIQKIADGKGGVALNILPENLPNVGQLISSAVLDNIVCLCEQEVSLNTAEARMSITVWWRTVKRACQIHGIFELLRGQKSKEQKTLTERYASLVKEQVVMSFRQAARYDRLGKFLKQFPLFVYQRKWVTWADWFQNVSGMVLIDCLPSIAPLSSVFFRDCFQLHAAGFQVMPALMVDYINDNLISNCKMRCEQEGEVIFNNVKKADSRHNDEKRVQVPTDSVPFKKALMNRLARDFPHHKVDSMVALLSKPGCKAQLAHTDYTPATLANTTDQNMPLACLVALVDDTPFDVWPGAIRFDFARSYKPMKVKLNKGDVLIFRGDLVHAGAACGEVENVRIHAYLDAVGVKRPKHGDGVEETHFIEKGIEERK
jgi:hypothetical protein